MESEKVKIDVDFCLEMEKKFFINAWWLLSGKGQMLENNDKNINNINNENLVQVPYLKDIYASAGGGAVNYDEIISLLNFEETFLKNRLKVASFKGLYVIKAIGDSMYPTINSHDLLFIMPFENENNQIKDSEIYVIQTPLGVLLKRVLMHPIKQIYTLISDNKQYENIVLKGDEVSSCNILGRVVGAMEFKIL